MLTYKPATYSTIQQQIEGQTVENDTQVELDGKSYPMAMRNSRNFLEVDVDVSRIFANFPPLKVMVMDNELRRVNDVEFDFFAIPQLPEDDAFTLPVGTFYRCAGETLRDLRQYTYFFTDDSGASQRIPNYQTLEVMLATRQKSYTSVFVIEQIQCDDITVNGVAPNLSGQWNSQLPDIVGYTSLTMMSSNIQSLNSIIDQLGASTAQQQQMVQQQLDTQQAAMQTAAAQSQAAADQASAAASSAAAAQATADAAAASAHAQADAAAAAVAALD